MENTPKLFTDLLNKLTTKLDKVSEVVGQANIVHALHEYHTYTKQRVSGIVDYMPRNEEHIAMYQYSTFSNCYKLCLSTSDANYVTSAILRIPEPYRNEFLIIDLALQEIPYMLNEWLESYTDAVELENC